MSLLEPFIDTVVICTMTALVIIITGQLEYDATKGIYIWGCDTINTLNGKTGVELTSAAFESSISWFPYVLAVSVVLFAFSTMISWSYYGLKAWGYLFGESPRKQLVFKIIFCGFVIIGAAMSLGPVIDFSDAAIFAMALVNIIGLYFLMPVVKTELSKAICRVSRVARSSGSKVNKRQASRFTLAFELRSLLVEQHQTAQTIR